MTLTPDAYMDLLAQRREAYYAEHGQPRAGFPALLEWFVQDGDEALVDMAATSRWKLDNRDSADMAGFFNLPKPVRWMVHHAHCDPDPDSGDYWFGVESARTHARILALTARLMAKSWLPFTDWDRFIERASRQEVC